MSGNSDFKDLKTFAGSALNVVTQLHTAGLAGYDKDTGQIKMGYETHAADEALGQVTGRNMQREMMQQQNENLVKAETQRQLDQNNLNEQNEVKDTQSSLAAKSATNQNSIMALLQSGQISSNAAQASSKIGSQKDFLGI